MDPHLFIRSYFFHPLQKQSAGLFWCGSHRHNTIFQNPLSSPTGPQSFGVIQTTSLAIFESMQHEKKHICHLCIGVSWYSCLLPTILIYRLSQKQVPENPVAYHPCPPKKACFDILGQTPRFLSWLRMGYSKCNCWSSRSFMADHHVPYQNCHLEAWGYTLQ